MKTTFLTVKDVAERYQVTELTIKRWKAGNKIPYLNINGSIRFDEARLTTWEQSRKVEPRKVIQ
jgi:predicted site-specific integrase-resolvase